MFELVCVTHRGLCAGDLPQRVGELCRGGIRRVILREKDLSEAEYEALARQVLAQAGDRVVLHHFPQVCARVGVPRLHLSLGQLEAQAPALAKDDADTRKFFLLYFRRLIELLEVPGLVYDGFHDFLELRVKGTLPQDKEKMLAKIDQKLLECEGQQETFAIVA